MRITYQSALQLSLPALAEIHTNIYGGSWVSAPNKLADIFRTLNIDLEHSLVAYDGRRPIGLALLGRRREHGWLYDFGIAPAYRGRGLGTRLLTTATREIGKAGVRDIELDVWEKRLDAIHIYERVGFTHLRNYLVFEADGTHLRLSELDIPARWRVTPCAVEEVTAWYAASHDEPEPSWDRRLSSLFTYGDAQACLLTDDEGAAICMYYAARPRSGSDPNRVRPLFVGMQARVGAAHLRALFAAVARQAFGDLATTDFRVALEPETSTLAGLLTQVGLKTIGRALDMRLSLARTPVD